VNLALDASTLEHAANAACRAALRAGLADHDARDLAQDALVRALTSAQPPAGVPLPAWVYGIAKNLGRDHAKSARRREVSFDHAPDASNDTDLATVLAVRSAVEDLPEPLRDVITLHELEDNSLRETADALQIPFDTAKDRLRRAREQLRARLGDEQVLASERIHTRKRAVAYGGAIVAGLYALLGQRSTAAAATGSVAAISASAGARAVPLWIAALVGGTLAVGGFVAGRVSAPTRHASTPVAIASASAGEEPAIEAAVARPAEAAPASAPAPIHPAPRVAAAPSHVDVVAPADNEEQLLLDRARAGLRRGMHDEALVTLMEHARRFADSSLAEERDVLIIEAYLRAGKPALAKKRIERYRADHPSGVLVARVDALAAELP
jgi:RNA polymerase sigma-70 factor (ECF subfamily)